MTPASVLYICSTDSPIPGPESINALDKFKDLLDKMNFEALEKFAMQITCMQEWAGPGLSEQREYLQQKLANGPSPDPNSKPRI